MTRRPDEPEPEPPGGRAAERLRQHLDARYGEGEAPPTGIDELDLAAAEAADDAGLPAADADVARETGELPRADTPAAPDEATVPPDRALSVETTAPDIPGGEPDEDTPEADRESP